MSFVATQLVGFATDTPTSAAMVPTMTAATTGGVTMSADAETSGTFLAWKAADGIDGSVLGDGWDASTALPHWLKVDFGAGNGKTVTSYFIRAGSGVLGPYAPANFTFEGSNDNTNWTVLHTLTGQSFTALEEKTYTPTSQGIFRYYRFNISVVGNAGNEVFIGEMDLIGY
jgi:roadblock/LC7 domain-containing protein